MLATARPSCYYDILSAFAVIKVQVSQNLTQMAEDDLVMVYVSLCSSLSVTAAYVHLWYLVSGGCHCMFCTTVWPSQRLDPSNSTGVFLYVCVNTEQMEMLKLFCKCIHLSKANI